VRGFYRLALSGFGFLVILAAALGQRSVASTDKPAAIGTGNLELEQRKELPSEAVSNSYRSRRAISPGNRGSRASTGAALYFVTD
jgi:hypothetical protein